MCNKMISSKFKGYIGYHCPLLVHLIKVFEFFHGFRVSILDIRFKNKNAKLAKRFLQHVLPQVRLP